MDPVNTTPEAIPDPDFPVRARAQRQHFLIAQAGLSRVKFFQRPLAYTKSPSAPPAHMRAIAALRDCPNRVGRQFRNARKFLIRRAGHKQPAVPSPPRAFARDRSASVYADLPKSPCASPNHSTLPVRTHASRATPCASVPIHRSRPIFATINGPLEPRERCAPETHPVPRPSSTGCRSRRRSPRSNPPSVPTQSVPSACGWISYTMSLASPLAVE